MRRKIMTILMALCIISSSFLGIRVNAAEETLPKIVFVGVNNPVLVGSKADIKVLTKYTGKVQYKVFVNEPGTSRKIWNEVTGKDFSEAMDASEPYSFPSINMDKEGEYSFAIRVKRAGTTGKYSNSFGDYDDAYAFVVKVIKDSEVKAGDMDGVIDTYFVGEKINIKGFKDAVDLEYKLHTFNVYEGWKKDLSKEYYAGIEEIFEKPGVYVLDLWGRKTNTNKKFDAVGVKVIKVIEKAPVEVKIDDLNEIRVNFNTRVSKAEAENFMIDGKPLDRRDTVELLGNGTYAVIKRYLPFEQNQRVKVTVQNIEEPDGKLIVVNNFDVLASDSRIPNVKIENLKEINVDFNKKLSSISSENFLIDGNKLSINDSIITSDDLKKVTILIKDEFLQKQNVKVTVKDIEYEDKTKLSTYDYNINVTDIKAPSPINVEQTGLSQLKITFDEPILRFTTDYIRIDDSIYYVNWNSVKINGREVSFSVGRTIQIGKHKLKVSGAADYAGNISKDNEINFEGIRDTKSPEIVKVEKATQNKVIIEYSEDIELNIKESMVYYHSILKRANRVEVNGKKLIITFDTQNKMPIGKTNIYIPDKAVMDSWGNYSSVVNGKEVNVEADLAKPRIKDVKISKGNEIQIIFDEEVIPGGLIRLYDKDSKEVPGSLFNVGYVEPDTIKLIFTNPMEPALYRLSVEGVKDIAGNEMDKDFRNIDIPDIIQPKIETKGKLYSDRNTIRIFFSEPMNIKDISDPSNYQLNNSYLSDIEGIFITPENEGKAVVIQFKSNVKISTNDKMSIAKMRDAAGNYTKEMVTVVSFDNQNASGIGIESVNVVDRSTVVVNLDDSIDTFELSDFEIYAGGSRLGIASGEKEISGGKTKLKLKVVYPMSGTTVDGMMVRTTSYPKTVNEYGVKLSANQLIYKEKIFDLIPPDIDTLTFSYDRREINIKFTENVRGDSMFRYSFTVSGNTVKKYEVISSNQVKITLNDPAVVGSRLSVTIRDVEDELGNKADLVSKTVDVR